MSCDPSQPDSENNTSKKCDEVLPEDMLVQLFRDIEPELLGTLYHLLKNTEDAKDALQEAFIRCWKRIDSIGEIQNVKAWVFRIAFNIGLDFRKSAWRKRRQTLPDDAGMVVEKSESPETVLAKFEELNRLKLAVASLDDGEKEVFLLRQNGDMTFEQIAQTLEIPVGTVKTRMRRAVMKLHGLLADE